MDFDETLTAYRERIETGIDSLLPDSRERPVRLHQAMRYSMAAGGKRIRPVLCLALADLFECRADPAPAGVAIECVHTYSLIHDDLPCMDDGVLRRGRPTCHREFDEATALLAGDALLTHAFGLLSHHYREDPALVTALVSELAEAAGSLKLIAGQVEDLENENDPNISLEQLTWINERKTAALLSASIVMGARLGRAGEAEITSLRRLGSHAGLAFQIIDDILDATSSEAALGKTTGADARQEKITFASRYGIERAREVAREHTQAARKICQSLPGDTTFLEALTVHLENRLK